VATLSLKESAMSVYFVYRSHYNTPTLNHVEKFKDATVLAWFQRHWRPIADYGKAAQYVRKTLGCDVYGFDSFLVHIAERSLAVPNSEGQLRRVLQRHLPVEREVRCHPHAIQALTDDDELDVAFYFFDDRLPGKAEKAAYLLHTDWRFPVASGDGNFQPAVATRKLKQKGNWAGTTYMAFLVEYAGGNLADLEGAWRLDGVRLPELVRYLARSGAPETWPYELLLLRSQVLIDPENASKDEQAFLRQLREAPEDDAQWNVYSDWLEDYGQPRANITLIERALRNISSLPVEAIGEEDYASLSQRTITGARQKLQALIKKVSGSRHSGSRQQGDPTKSLLQVEEHIAQICLHADRWHDYEVDIYHRWIFFDDLWASAHRDLANGILCYARRWDVLS
jgi:uncharacterized protein (TIGR02996 family)